MPQRLPYYESCRVLQREQLIDDGDIPSLPDHPPRFDDEVLGVNFFRTLLADVKLESLTLPRTFTGRSEIRATSFRNCDLSESTANWNDFLEVDFTASDLSLCDFRSSVFRDVCFVGANLRGTDFRHCNFTNCDFTDAEVTGAKLTKKSAASLIFSRDQQNVIDWQVNDGNEPDGG